MLYANRTSEDGAKLSVDAMDNQETYDIAFGMAGAELMRTKVAPEADAFTFATLAGIADISKGEAKTLTDAAAFLNELLEAKNKMDKYGLVDVYKNKKAGIYLSHKA
ncbi:MAG: hypothetical protein NC412_13930 [Roseburia sp.]|nr:hypothetical protein [Roseburia sp.]MCM1280197.1 hypothetical protein [Robinsoniella sp.]